MKYLASPKTANNNAKKPLINKPKLKIKPVKPGTTPRSLNALLVQLKEGYETIAIMMHVNATIGAAIPDVAPIFKQL